MIKNQIVEKNRRYGRGVAISVSRKVIKLHQILYKVESETTDGKFYSVIFKEGAPTSCNCFDHLTKNNVCKHQFALMKALENNTLIDETDKPEELSVKSFKEDEYTF